MSGGPGVEALRSPPRGGGGGRGRGLLEVGQRLGPVVPETPGRWVDPGRRTRALSYGQAPLRAASRRPGWVLLEGPDRGRTVLARKVLGSLLEWGSGGDLSDLPECLEQKLALSLSAGALPAPPKDRSFC